MSKFDITKHKNKIPSGFKAFPLHSEQWYIKTPADKNYTNVIKVTSNPYIGAVDLDNCGDSSEGHF